MYQATNSFDRWLAQKLSEIKAVPANHWQTEFLDYWESEVDTSVTIKDPQTRRKAKHTLREDLQFSSDHLYKRLDDILLICPSYTFNVVYVGDEEEKQKRDHYTFSVTVEDLGRNVKTKILARVSNLSYEWSKETDTLESMPGAMIEFKIDGRWEWFAPWGSRCAIFFEAMYKSYTLPWSPKLND